MSLFSGVELVGLAGEYVGFRTVGHCEISPHKRAVIRRHWQGTALWWDVRHITRRRVIKRLYSMGVLRHDPAFGPLVDLLSFGIPCQPHSFAGRRQGGSDPRSLWDETARAIREIVPRRLLGENVPGIRSSDDGLFLAGVYRDLARLGYQFGWAEYGAVDVGAPHKRDRYWLLGLLADSHRAFGPGNEYPLCAGGAAADAGRQIVADASGPGRREPEDSAGVDAQRPDDSDSQGAESAVQSGERRRERGRRRRDRGGAMEDSQHGGRSGGPAVWKGAGAAVPSGAGLADSDRKRRYWFRWPEWAGWVESAVSRRDVAHTDRDRSQGAGPGQPAPGDRRRPDEPGSAGGAGPVADAGGAGPEGAAGGGLSAGWRAGTAGCRGRRFRIARFRWLRRDVEPGLGRAIDGCPPWLVGDRWPAGPGDVQKDWEAPRTARGVKGRGARLKAMGEGIVPAQVLPALLVLRADLLAERGGGARE